MAELKTFVLIFHPIITRVSSLKDVVHLFLLGCQTKSPKLALGVDRKSFNFRAVNLPHLAYCLVCKDFKLFRCKNTSVMSS